jgi:hypothetical protein
VYTMSVSSRGGTCEPLDPPVDAHVVDLDAAFGQELLDVLLAWATEVRRRAGPIRRITVLRGPAAEAHRVITPLGSSPRRPSAETAPRFERVARGPYRSL